MLALKDLRPLKASTSSRKLLDLPDELLESIVIEFQNASLGRTRDLLALSATCSRWRRITAPFIFHTIHIRLTDRYVDKRTFNILLNCQIAKHQFASHIRHIVQDDTYCFRETGCEDLRISNELVRALILQALRAMSNLESISVGCVNSPILFLVSKIYPRKAFHFLVEVCCCSGGFSPARTIAHELCLSKMNHKFSFVTSSFEAQHSLEPWFSTCPKQITAVVWQHDVSFRTAVRHNAVGFARNFRAFENIEELHLKYESMNNTFDGEVEELLLSLQHLRRLSVAGLKACAAALTVVSRLETLESIRFLATSNTLFHTFLRNHSFEGSPYLRLPLLRSLEIRYISRYFSVKHIVPAQLQHLRIEYADRTERITPFNLRWIASHAPEIQCLEMDIGGLANLWHPTAIAGVDVDMDVYGLLDALTEFKNLRVLRLFPSYWTARLGNLHFRQPVDDEQAVKIFNHLRPLCHNLEVLYISNSFLDYRARHLIFSKDAGLPVKWIVRAVGSRVLLTTHQAMKNYHLEQIWEGDRRLTMSTVRHGFRRRHFDELQPWTLPHYEFAFDEPEPCHAESVLGGSQQENLARVTA